jgi:hypothetical protein
MSNPTDRAIDPRDPLAFAPKWARDPAMAERRNSARQRFASPPDEDNFFGSDTAEPFLVDEGETIGRGSRPSLDPSILPARLSLPRARFWFGMAGGLTIAAAVIAALYVVGKLPPWSVVAKDDSAETTSFGSRFAGATVVARPANEEERSGGAPRGSATHQVAGTSVKPASPTPRLDAEEITVLLKRGQELVAVGDLASARVVLRRAAEAREPRAALALAGTYDPIVLEKLAVYGLRADISSARSWYEKAKEFGSEEAPRRLEMLAGREQ